MKKKILFIIATHGDESFSLPVLQKLEVKYPKKQYAYDWVIGNPKALKQNIRFVEKDLNRSAPGSQTSVYYEERRAYEILNIAKNYDYIFDIHGTKAFSGIVTIVSLPTLENILLSGLLPIQNVVIWNAEQSRVSGPLPQYMGKPSVGIECGPKNSIETKNKLESVLIDIILNFRSNTISSGIKKLNKKTFYEVYGKLEGNRNKTDFKKYRGNGEKYFAFLGNNQYSGISCYKMRKILFSDLFLSKEN